MVRAAARRRDRASRGATAGRVRRGLVVAALTAASLSACDSSGSGAPGAGPEAGACPDSFTAGVLWTSVQFPDNGVQLYQDDRLAAEIRLPAQGVSADTQAPLYVGGELVALSTGDVNYDQTNVIVLDFATCDVELTPVDRPAVLNLALRDGGYVTNNNLNAVSELRSINRSGEQTGAADYPATSLDVAVEHQGRLYSHLIDDASGRTEIVVSDPVTLAEIGRHVIDGPPAGAAAWSMAVAGGKLWFPITMDEAEQPDTRLAAVDLDTMEARLIDLGAPLPFQVLAANGLVYVAHTFMNPGFGALSGFRHVSIVDPVTQAVTGRDLAAGVSHIAVSADRLVALGEDADGGFILHSYDLAGFELIDKFAVEAPAWMPDAYAVAAVRPVAESPP